MASNMRPVRSVGPAVNRAAVLICEKCGRRVAGGDKNPSHRLASKLKKASKRAFEKGAIKPVLTSCLEVCPDEAVTVVIVPAGKGALPEYFEVSVDDLDDTCESLIAILTKIPSVTH